MVAPPACRETTHDTDQTQMYVGDSVWSSNNNKTLSNYSGTALLQRLRIFVFHERRFFFSLAASLLHLNSSDWCWKRRSCKGKKERKKPKHLHADLPLKTFQQAHRDGVPPFDRTWSSTGRHLKILQKPQASFPLVSVLLSKKKRSLLLFFFFFCSRFEWWGGILTALFSIQLL